MNKIKCTECGKITMVPFKPTTGKPVYCRTCFSKRNNRQREVIDKNFSFDSKQAWARRGNDWQGRRPEKTKHIF
jgi:CxxC-x17-CxxC domain-containing protein